MIPAQLAALLIPLLPVSPATPDPQLSIAFRSGDVVFHLDGPAMPYLGGVLLSFDPTLCHYFQGLPPLLCDHAVLAVGVAQGRLTIVTPERLLPPGIFMYAQGVVADDLAIRSTRVVSFVLDGSPPIGG